MRWKKILFLAFGHVAADFYPGMLAPLLPLVIERYGWSMARAGVLIMAMQISANAGQVVVGILNDHRPQKAFLWAGPLISAIPFSLVFMVQRFDLMLIVLAVSGFGVAMYHPVGVVAAGHIAHENRRGISMALFSAGGSVGVAIAPLALVFIVQVLDERYMPLIVLPAVVMAFYFICDKGFVVSDHKSHTVHEMIENLRENSRELFLLWIISSFRAMVYVILGSFLPMLMIARGSSFAVSNYFLSATLLAGMVGLFIGGHLSDIYGRRRIMAITMLASSPLLFGFLHTNGILSTVFILIGTSALSSTIPVNIILAQRATPKLAGMASSLVMGVSFMMGAVVAPPFGAIADSIGIETAMNVIFTFPLLGGITVFFLRKE